ncbi:MAG TPA: hypothetical protein VL359_06340, partial [bacterium]|nr:hypothetical protein [bacterium]
MLRSAGWYVGASVAVYAITALLLTRFVAPDGVALVLLAIPLYTVTWAWGRNAGFIAAAAGAVVNPGIWIIAGNGTAALAHASPMYAASLAAAECAGGAALVLLVSALRRGEQESRRDA